MSTKKKMVREYWRKITIKHRYNLTPDEYNKIFTRQKGRCAICGRHQSEFKKRLYIDHNHRTKIIRGLLCCNCNFILGAAQDDIEILQSAIEYLKEK